MTVDSICGTLAPMNIHGFVVKGFNGKDFPLSEFKGKALLIVNVASKCGFTSQYKGLQSLYEKYKDKGLVILGFPCNQFGGQEPGTESEIQSFCETTFGVTFPLFAKIDVNGKNADPLYQYLVDAAPGLLGINAIKWNFTKFLVDPDGKTVTRFAPKDSPEEIESIIVKRLPK